MSQSARPHALLVHALLGRRGGPISLAGVSVVGVATEEAVVALLVVLVLILVLIQVMLGRAAAAGLLDPRLGRQPAGAPGRAGVSVKGAGVSRGRSEHRADAVEQHRAADHAGRRGCGGAEERTAAAARCLHGLAAHRRAAVLAARR